MDSNKCKVSRTTITLIALKFCTLRFICNGGNLIISFQIFAGIFPKNYEPPPGDFYFEVDAESPVVQVS
jgi:hypothetical protein